MSTSDCSQLVLNFLLNMRIAFLQNCSYKKRVQKKFLKKLQISQESTCVGVFFNKVAGPQNYNFVKQRLHHRFFPDNFLNYLRAPILQRIDERLVLKHQCSFIRTSFFKEHLQWLLLTVSGSSLQLYSLKETLAKMFICEFCKIFKNIFRQNTSG